MKLAKHDRVQLIRVPGHEGTKGNETANELAKLGSECLIIGLEQGKGVLQGPSVRRTKELLKVNRNQLWWVTGLLSGHCHLKGHVFKIRLTNILICERCLEKDKSATYILYDCEAIPYLRFCHLDHYFMEPGDYHDAPASKIRFEIDGDAQ
jgi:hypothetical protein